MMLTALDCTKNTPRLTNLDDIKHLPSSSCSWLISHNLSTTDIAFAGSHRTRLHRKTDNFNDLK